MRTRQIYSKLHINENIKNEKLYKTYHMKISVRMKANLYNLHFRNKHYTFM